MRPESQTSQIYNLNSSSAGYQTIHFPVSREQAKHCIFLVPQQAANKCYPNTSSPLGWKPNNPIECLNKQGRKVTWTWRPATKQKLQSREASASGTAVFVCPSRLMRNRAGAAKLIVHLVCTKVSARMYLRKVGEEGQSIKSHKTTTLHWAWEAPQNSWLHSSGILFFSPVDDAYWRLKNLSSLYYNTLAVLQFIHCQGKGILQYWYRMFCAGHQLSWQTSGDKQKIWIKPENPDFTGTCIIKAEGILGGSANLWLLARGDLQVSFKPYLEEIGCLRQATVQATNYTVICDCEGYIT